MKTAKKQPKTRRTTTKSRGKTPLLPRYFVYIGLFAVIMLLAAAIALAQGLQQPGQLLPSASGLASPQDHAPDDEMQALAARWFTARELETLEWPRLQQMVAQRQGELAPWLTPEEMERLTPLQMLNVAGQRNVLAQRGLQAGDMIDRYEPLDKLDEQARQTLVETLSVLPADQWEAHLNQLTQQVAAANREDAEQALVKAGGLGWLTGTARSDFIDKLLQKPQDQWGGMIQQLKDEKTAGDAQLKKEAEAAVAAADLSWLPAADKTKLVNSLIAAPKNNWNSLIAAQVAGKEAYFKALALAAVKANADLKWLTGAERTEFVAYLATLPQSSWKAEMEDKAAEKPPSSKPPSSSDPEAEEETGGSGGSSGGGSGGSGATLKVYDTGSGKTVTGDEQTIVAQVVQNEMGSKFHTQALKAQAIAASTFIRFENAAGRSPSVRLSTPSSTVKNAVKAVAGQAIYYNNRLAFTPYYATSAGQTNSSADVWGGHYDYLISVDSSVDEDAPGYRSTVTMTASEVASRVKSKLGVTLEGDPGGWIEVVSYTDGGYNAQMKVGGKTTTGRVMRESVLNLRSAAFEIDYDEGSGKFTFTVYGYGHGVGMSQNGANLYAQQGWSYEEILDHYYPGTTVK